MEKQDKQGKQGKLTYEQVVELAHQLSEQNMMLKRQVQELSLEDAFQRLHFLFEVAKNPQAFKDYEDGEFYDYCRNQIKKMIVLPETPQESPENDTNMGD